jgi:formylglycine-generating enzyme required for sulfatase activity
MAWRQVIAWTIIGALAHAAVGQTLPAGIQVKKDVTYATADGKSLLMDFYAVHPFDARDKTFRSPLLVRIGPVRETPGASGAAAELLAKGYTLAYAAYAPAADATHVFSRFPQDLWAAKAAIRYVRGQAAELDIDPERIGVWGAGPGASIAALAGVTSDQTTLNGKLGDFVAVSSAVRAVCLFEGVTDWRYAELYGDETVNFPGSPAYQLFGGNPKEHSEEARQASAVNYVRPKSPATLMITLASDPHRAMHQIFAETLRRAGVPSALYEAPAASAGRTGGVDEAALNRTVVAFFEDTLKGDRGQPRAMSLDEEIEALTKAGLFKQARRLVDDQVAALPAGATSRPRMPWLQKLQIINEQEQAPAIKQLVAARKAAPPAGLAPGTPLFWTIREVLTNPERIGQYAVEKSVAQVVFDKRATAMRAGQLLNAYVLKGDWAEGDRQLAVMKDMAARGDADAAILNALVTRYGQIRGKAAHVWPPALRGMVYAADFGQDLYGYWMDFSSGGVTQRLRYVPPGQYVRGSALDEWGRLPGEPILEPTTIAQGFWLGEAEVTQGMYEAVVGTVENHSIFRVSGANREVRKALPVENVSYAHAVNFMNRLGLETRLPTEAEWEYACRAGVSFMYSGTGRLSDMAWFWDEARPTKDGSGPVSPAVGANGELEVRILHELEMDTTDVARLTHPVKQKLPNAWGLFDMQGNVWEWCSGTSPEKPRDYHPAKGGSWLSIPQSCRAARDVWLPVEQQAWNVGMRICITAK